MARTFDGTNDQIAFGSEAAIDDVSPWTAVALVRITSNVTDERQIINKMNSSYNGTMYISASGGGGNNNKIVCLRSGSASLYAESAVNALVVNTWRVIITSWDGAVASTFPKIYACDLGGDIAELSYTSQSHISGPITDASATLRIGARDPLDATFFAGGLAECAIWNRVLTADEMRALGKGFAPAFFPRGRVFYCPITGRYSTEPNWAGTTHGTVTEATYLEHPRVIYPALAGPVRATASSGGSPAILDRGIGRAIMRGIGRFM